jgi:hypothetical protein
MRINWKAVRTVGCALGVLLAAAVAICVGWFGYVTLNRVRAHTTETRLAALMQYIVLDQPSDLSPQVVGTILRKYGLSGDYEVDGWGRSFVIEMWRDKARQYNHYRVISLGRSGRRGPCCTANLGYDWDGNAVMQDFEWLQRWAF